MLELPQRVRFSDVDGAGIVYYPRYFNLCHDAFEQFFTAVGPVSYPHLVNDLKRGFPTVHVEADYKRPLRYGDVALVEVAVTKVGHSSAAFRYRFRREGDAERALHFEARLVTAYMDLSTGRSLPMDEATREALRAHAVDAEG